LNKPRYPGVRITTNGNQLVSYHTEARITEGGVFYPITPSTEMGESYQLAFAEGKTDVFGHDKIAIEAEGEHAAQGGAIALSVCGKRVVNFTSGQGIVYGLEQYYHAPGKLSTMVLEVAARALTKHALNVHCGHDDIYAALDTGWIMLFAKDSQQAADQALILRRVTELALNPGINVQDGFLTSHLERTFLMHEADLLREFLGAPEDIIDCPTEAQRTLFGPNRRRVPVMIDLKNPMLLGPVQNQEHYMNGVIARRNNFSEPILGFLEQAYADFAELTGRSYGLISEYKTDDAETVFVSLGSAAENIEEGVDYLRKHDGAKVGSIHVNVLRPFPEAAIVRALGGKQNVIVLERTDESLSGDNPLTREIRSSLNKAVEADRAGTNRDLPPLAAEDVPLIFSGSYGLGSRDFRPKGILGAFEYAIGKERRKDGRGAADGERYFVLGIDHPYAVVSKRKPSFLPEGAIAVRLHSIGGWGMITTGKNLGEIIGVFGEDIARRNGAFDEFGRLEEVLHISANPKYGSEKKGAPTAYFLVVAPERVRVNCDLRHTNVVLCCDPKAFTHMNPLDGMAPGSKFVWESDEEPEVAWQRIPPKYRKQILEKNIELFTLSGFKIARAATSREDLQLRMQGNSFLGAFFRISGLLETYGIDAERFREVVRGQYEKKFGRFGKAVVESNMTVMTQGYELVRSVPHGKLDARDRSSMRRAALVPCESCNVSELACAGPEQEERPPIARVASFDREFRAGLGYHQPASTLSSVGVMAAATGATASKYVARRETPVWIAENCTQCMECITACPDTALPNTAQDVLIFLTRAAEAYVTDAAARELLLAELPALAERLRARMLEVANTKGNDTFESLLMAEVDALPQISEQARKDYMELFQRVPFAFQKTPAVFRSLERKEGDTGGLFAIMVSDLCKGCAECVVECGDKNALVMAEETPQINADHVSGVGFLDLLPDTPQKYLGRFDAQHPEDSHSMALRNHLMVRSNYEALVSGDGACAGCGEKSVLHACVSLTEAYMRPIFHAKADRLKDKAERLEATGAARLETMRANDPEGFLQYRRAVAHLLMGLGGETMDDTDARIGDAKELTDDELVAAIVAVMRRDAFGHEHLQPLDGSLPNGMAVMAMAAHTGCNTVYGSTPPNNPHPYPWMNSLFQDGATVGWLFGESFIMDHARRSVIPERLCDVLHEGERPVFNQDDYFALVHLKDTRMTPREIRELPKVWVVGGDGGMGDIGFQNVSKVVLQNRPNVNLLMLDTQVYSNTGGQNSDSTPMPGGGDMNQFGAASDGKYTEKKGVAEALIGGHGSPFVAQVSMANVPKFYGAVLAALQYRGGSFLQCFTTCQPEHGVPDDMATVQASRIRDARVMPEFVFDPTKGETFQESLDLQGNPQPTRDWAHIKSKATGLRYQYTSAHWAVTEARFRRHFKKVQDTEGLVFLEELLLRVTQDDIVHRRVLDPTHHSHVPDFGSYIEVEDPSGELKTLSVSRQMVLFCVERRRSWRLLQSRAGLENADYKSQRAIHAVLSDKKTDATELCERLNGLFDEELKELLADIDRERARRALDPFLGASLAGK
jgi:pyruvate-ferredoxin/flavodoxin oxidoreductase